MGGVHNKQELLPRPRYVAVLLSSYRPSVHALLEREGSLMTAGVSSHALARMTTQIGVGGFRIVQTAAGQHAEYNLIVCMNR